jgi:hypothetical protein
LSKFPADPVKIYDCIRNFYNDIGKQHSFANVETHSLEYWQKDPHFKNFTIEAIGYGKYPTKLAELESINSHDIYMYVNLDNCPIPVPVSDTVVKAMLYGKCKEAVSVKDKVYYSEIEAYRDETKCIIKFGNAYNYTIPIDNSPRTLNYTRPSNITDYIKALKLLIAIVEHKELKIGNISVNNIELGLQLQTLEQEERQIQDIYTILTALHVDLQSIDMQKLSNQDYMNLLNLKTSIIDGMINNKFKVKQEFENAIICTVPISDKVVRVFVEKTEQGNKMYDYFSNTDKLLALERNDGKFSLVSFYSLLTTDELCKTLNINPDGLVIEYKELYGKFPPIIPYAIETLNRLLSAYDKCKAKKLLQMASMLNDWLQTIEIEDITPYSKLLYTQQIQKRQRRFTETEKETLYNIADTATDIFDKFSSYILLDDKTNAERLYKKQSKKIREYLKTQPIYNLYKSL